ncbi:MAG: hypothetical protein QF921_14805 [Pseudomonadales bacterium]|jgi:hypothetical protein|nr:hypothetical protein [Pseudomonadales bacterium]MDP6470184.1 hypothetical protein [Pseudomonadales bacterium]MDP6827090.1 hypothetical protein [Pseudomonadales bacterium]MDP6972752.1 hypothetical protein [Pseudomonadales bacterium]|tara:strand:- start:91 stop:1179 length:1089 start_codon:yes stop_codon:yes gene_type:complete
MRPFPLSIFAIAATLMLAACASSTDPAVSGHPDLSGTYNVATLTPLERPDQFSERLTLTDEEADAIAARVQAFLKRDSAPSDPNRDAPEAGGTEFFIPGFEFAAGGVGGYNGFFIELGDSNFKLDGKWRTSIITAPSSGKLPPLSERGQARVATIRQSAFMKNTGTAWWIDHEIGPYDDPELRPLGERCLLGFGSTSGPPALPVMYNNLKRIVQTQNSVMILSEMNHDARVVRMNSKHLPRDVRKWMGDSIGWWEGDTLVVDTTNFRGLSGLYLYGASEALHVVERFSRLDDKTLRYSFTVEDPNTWEHAWSGEYPWPSTNEQVYEYACHEGNYALGGILRGARLLEHEALAACETGAAGSD